MQYRIVTPLSLLCVWMVIMTSACGDNFLDIIQENEEWHTCELTLNVTRTSFSDETLSRSTDQWSNGSKIYLTFDNGKSVSYGNATYENGSWILSYNGKLAEGNSVSCTAVYFDKVEAENGTVVNLSPQSAVYEDKYCSYNYQNGKLSIGANLKPKTGRIRFTGSDGSKITILGISHYSSFDYASGKFFSSNVALSVEVTSNYTPYIYGEFSDMDQPRLNLITSTSAYTRFPSSSIYRPGESGYMRIPSESTHHLWTNAAIFKINGVEFTLIPVTYSSGNFLLAETETTEELYNAVLGLESTSSQNPKIDIDIYERNDFFSKLNAQTGLEFRAPTLLEWQYAYRGGEKTQGYSYSGSNIISNVGWYSGNSANAIHPVKQLQPNELGLYDMTGNASEYVSGASAYFYGGAYNSPETQCLPTDGTYFQGTSGLRIAISN